MFTAFTSTCGMLVHIERCLQRLMWYVSPYWTFTITCGMLVHIEQVDVYSVSFYLWYVSPYWTSWCLQRLLLPVVCYSILNELMFTAFTYTCGMLVHIERVDVYSVYFYLWYVSPYWTSWCLQRLPLPVVVSPYWTSWCLQRLLLPVVC